MSKERQRVRHLAPGASEELAAVRQQLLSILEITPDAIITASVSGRILSFNRGAEEMFGHRAAEVIGRPVELLIPERFRARHAQDVARFARGRDAARYMSERGRVVGLRKDGSEFPAEASIARIGQPAGAILAAIVRDITEQVRAEEALRESEERLRSLIMEAPIILLRLDEHGVIVFCEGRCLDLVGVAPGELVGRSAWSIAAARPEALRWLQAVYAGDAVCGTFETGDRAFQMRLIPTVCDGHVTGVTGVLIDSTERRELEQRLYRAQRLEAIGQLAGGVAHDFNNLLTVINGYADLALRSVGEDHPARRDLQEIRNAAERAGVLTRQLLAFSRRQSARPAIVDVNSTVRNVEAMLQRLLGAPFELVVELDAREALVLADAGQLEQIVMNLAINARDAMPEGGRLLIQTRAEDDVVLRVADTGIGMAPEVLERIFDPFFTTKRQGTGLGLATVHSIVSQAGGSIDVESEPGRGTTFTIRLPRAEPRTPAKGNADESSPPPATLARILVVEPDGQVRDFVTGVLRREGYTVVEVPGGREAMEAVQREGDRIDLAICGLVLPGESGVDLAERLRAKRQDLKVLLTATAAGRRSPRAGQIAYLRKPFTAGPLLRRVRELLARPGSPS